MEVNEYKWDIKESALYGSVDFSSNFFNIYLERRKQSIDFFKDKSSLSLIDVKKDFYPDDEFMKLNEFASSKVIASLYYKINKNEDLNPLISQHFWRILKKADLKKLTKFYDSDFKNLSKTHLSLEDHALLALTLGLYSRNRRGGYLQALSTSLKMNDFLVSEMSSLKSDLEILLTLNSLEVEREQVTKLRIEHITKPLESNYDINKYLINSHATIKDLGMIIQEGNRSKAYLQALTNNGLYPNFVLLLKDASYKGILDAIPTKRTKLLFDPRIPEIETLKKFKIPYIEINASSCNTKEAVDEINKRSEKYFIFSGRGALDEILDTEKKFIHVHPGKLPEYRGSTCYFYSVLAGDGWWCTSFLMKKGIDEGDILISKKIPLPNKEIDDEKIYDPYSRSNVLVDTIRQLAEKNELKPLPQNLSKGVDYYIIHPVLRFIMREYLDRIN